MELLNKSMTNFVERPIKVLQFGEGGFLRAFVDYMIDIANEKGDFNGNIVIVKPIEFGNLDFFHQQDCQYTLELRGKENGEAKKVRRQITSVADAVGAVEEYDKFMAYASSEDLRFIVSNTTEAGIVFDASDDFNAEPPKTYPGKLTKFLYTRFKAFNGALDKGLIMLPVELIDNNGPALKKCVFQFIELWNLGEEFKNWVTEACIFGSTLVDRIVTGYPRDEAESMWEDMGYRDNLLDTGELFALWVIESEKEFKDEFPLDKAGLPVIFTDNQKPYKERKVRILNGAHTSFVLASFLAGNDIVLESMNDKTVRTFMENTIFNEVIPTLSLPEAECKDFANAVIERFENPYVKHQLLSIALNSVSKWRARCKPSLTGYINKKGELPKHLTFSIAALMAFYSATEFAADGTLVGKRDGKDYTINDSKDVLDFFAANSTKPTAEFVQAYLSNEDFHGEDLTRYEGLADAVASYLDDIKANGMRKALENVIQ